MQLLKMQLNIFLILKMEEEIKDKLDEIIELLKKILDKTGTYV